MPELPEVEAVRRRLQRECLGARIEAVTVQRPGSLAPQSPESLRRVCHGSTIIEADRRAKHLFLHLDNGHSMHIHLRMTGNVYVLPDHRLRPARARVIFALADGRALIFDDPRCLGRVHVHRTAALADALPPLGPEPLEGAFSRRFFVDSARASRSPAKLFLMDQSKVAGLGNIYAAEALYEARIDPRKPIGSISVRRLGALHEAIRNVLHVAIPCCERAYSKPGQFIEADEYPMAVYGREGLPCPRCATPVARIPQGGRSTYFCPRCQR
jgi:formamidopyrimidine-DNA glycosylase